jgi:hypothetical protein
MGALLLGFIALLPLVLPNPSNINSTKFDMLEVGMTREGVQKLLGQTGPPMLQIVSNRLYLVYSEDKPDRFPPGDWIWIELDPNTDKILMKSYARPEYAAFWEHAINRVCTAVGRRPPFPIRMPNPLPIP